MASEFTPTIENLISAYAWAATDDDAEHRAAEARRAIEAHDRTERAAAWDEGYDTGCNDEAFEARGIPSDPGSKEHPHANPYRERGE